MIALVNPWSTPSPKKPLPMSLLALGSMIEGEFDYQIIDGNIDPDPLATIEALAKRRRLQAVAMTVMPGPQLTYAVPLSRAIKQRWPGVPIIWGGYFPSHHADVALKDDAVDYCVRGQGEHSFLQLVRVLARGGGVDDIPGVSARDGSGTHHAPIAPLAPLDPLPMWPYERVRMDRYLPRHYLGARVAAHHSSYGCPFGCNFCAVVPIAKRRWVAESPERVGSVLSTLHHQYGADAVQFHDMDFFISEPRAAAIAERLRSLDMRWWALGRVDELMRYKSATWEGLKRSGLKMVFCGAESGSTETLRRMNKGGTAAAELTLDFVKRARTYGVIPELSFVVGNPPDPEADLQHTLTFIRTIKSINAQTEIILYVYSPVSDYAFPQTLDEWVSPRWQAFSIRRDPQTPWSPTNIRTRVRNFETVMNAYYPTATDMRLTGWRRYLLRASAAWRYHTRADRWPVELDVLQRAFRYRRPETTGF